MFNRGNVLAFPPQLSGLFPTNDQPMPPKGDQSDQQLRRQKPRRLFSLESLKSSRNSSADHELPQLNPFDLSDVQEVDEQTIHAPRAVRSTTEPSPHTRSLVEPEFLTAQAGRSRLEPVRPIAIAPVPLRAFTVDSAQPTPSPTRARWENLRQHVIPSASRPATPPQRPPSAQSSTHNIPKPSRLARLGFRHVVEQARDVIDDTRKLGEEIQRACAIARYPEYVKTSKENLTGGGTMVSSVASGKMSEYLRRPQSVSATSLPSAPSNLPSIQFLYRILLYHSTETPHSNVINLPHEAHVLSTLLCPFLSPGKYGRAEEEQMTAVETFELLAKSWAPVNEAATVGRSVWCTKAAASIQASDTRTRILGSLWRLLMPTTTKLLLTPSGFHSISSNLLLLLAALYRSSGISSISSNPYTQSPSFKTSIGYSFPSANFKNPPHPDINLIQDLIPHFLSASLGEVEDDNIEEVYSVGFNIADRRNLGNVRRALFSESLVATIENAPGTGEWLLCNTVEHYWPLLTPETWSTLQAAISSRRINSFCRLSLSFLIPFIAHELLVPLTPGQISRLPSSSSTTSSMYNFSQLIRNVAIPSEIVSILESRVIPEAEVLDKETELKESLVDETRKLVATLVLELICLDTDIDGAKSSPNPGVDVFGTASQSFSSGSEIQAVVKWARMQLCRWYEANDLGPWKVALERALAQIISQGWSKSTHVLSALLKQLPDNIRKPVFMSMSVSLNNQLVEHPPPYPSPRVSEFLTSFSRTPPPISLIFFKPLFACAASDKEAIVINHLCTLQTHSKYVDDYWVRDVDMICFALLGSAKDMKQHDSPDIWGVARLGQLVLFVELIGHIQTLRHQKDGSQTQGDGSFSEILRFAASLEARVWSMIEFQERTQQIPPSLRMLLCILFRELRLLTRSLKPAPWLTRTLQWFHTYCGVDYIGDLEQDVDDAVERIQALYLAAQAGVQERHKRHTSMLAANVHRAPTPAESTDRTGQFDLAATFVKHRKLIDSLSKGYISKSLKLFVAMSSLISADDSVKLAPLLWQHCLLDNVNSSLTASSCFMLMQCTEKAPMEVRPMIELDMQSSDDMTRLEAVRKISILINWRFQIMNQQFISDRTHRPFKLARPPLPFIATDIGSSLYIPSEDPKETKDKDDVPLELRRRLAELGWTEDDGVIIDPRHEIIKTPFSVLPIQQWERQEVGTTDMTAGGPPSPLGSPQPSPRKHRDNAQLTQPDDMAALLRRNSSSGGPSHGVKRRAVFVPALTLIFPRLCTLISDPDFSVASAARTTILDLMRNDPALLTRPMLDLLAGEGRDVKFAMTTFTALMHVRRVLPPSVAHNIFNSLAGLLKLLARDEKAPDVLEDFGQILPVMSSLATQVSGISMREIRRAKIEHFIIPTGSLWFSSAAPKGAMFPRSLGSSENPFEPVSSRLVSITMIRVAQNMFFLAMLKRNAQDVQVVRKNMAALTLPSLNEDGFSKTLELLDFMPHKFQPDTRPSIRNGEIEILSLMVARSSIMLIAQIFRSMPRHLSDRNELAILVDGLNRSLVAHGDDINIVSHVLIALMVASTRFRRLFTAGGGYTLFMPALVKVYSENPSHPGIRNAIEYSFKRFYALHKDSFLYQTVNITGQMCMLPQVDSAWFSKAVYDLISSLRRGISPSAADIGGIYNANRVEEREALILHTADEKPQAFLASIKRTESESGRHMSLHLPDEYENHRLDMPDFVRLFWTIIAHDLSISRAQYFLRLLLLLTPHLYNTSSKTKTVLSDGIDALGQILNKVYSKPKASENIKSTGRDDDNASFGSTAGLQEKGKEKVKSLSDSKTLRLDYLRLIIAFGSSGGQVTLATARYAFDIVRSLLKDWGDTDLDVIAHFLDDFLKMLLNRPEHANPKAIVAFLQELSPLLRLPVLSSLDLTGVYETVLKFSEIPLYASDSHFCRVVVEDICSAGLQACDVASRDNQLMTLSYRPILISLLAESIFLKGTDVISQLEKLSATYQNLSAIFLPLTLSMKTEAQVIASGLMTEQHRVLLAAAWVRILFYAITACQNGRRDADGARQLRGLAGSFTRLKSNGKDRQDGFWRSHLPTLMTALQVVKVIIIRGAADISFLPELGIWERLADFFKSILAEGGAEFALRTDPSSTATTPTGSPRSSRQFNLSNSANSLFVSSSFELSRPTSPISHATRTLTCHRPRIIDYSLWSVLEFACAYRSPLRMQLKVLTMEKVVALDRALLCQAWSKGGTSPIPVSASSRRFSTSLFSKTRQRASGLLGPSPDSSPRITPSSSLMASPSFLDIPKLGIPSRRPGYQVSPVTPNDRPAGQPKIVHLGPVSPSALSPNISPMIGGLKASKSTSSGTGTDADIEGNVAKTTKIRSLRLIQETYRRIRGVQVYMGYELLLPIPGMILSKEKDEDAGLDTWTTSQALKAIVNETRDLLEEFEESFTMDEESVLVEVDQTMPSYPSSPK